MTRFKRIPHEGMRKSLSIPRVWSECVVAADEATGRQEAIEVPGSRLDNPLDRSSRPP
jgi:hypothetical protein